jgi:hypothetical protein
LFVSEIIRTFANGAERIRSAEEALCSKLASENLGNFQSKTKSNLGAERLPRIVRGAVLHFLLLGFPRTFTRNWQKQSRASAMEMILGYLIIKDVDYE